MEEKQQDTPTTTPTAPLLGQEGRETQPPKAAPFTKGDFSAWQMAWELGYTIAIPIVVLALAGRYADRVWGTSPWLLLAGVLISVIISSAMVYRKVKKIL